MAAVPEDFLTTGFPVLLEDSLKKCQFHRAPIFTYHEHWINDTETEYHVEVIVKANDSPTSWFFEGPQMATLVLAVETATLKALTRLRDLLPEMADELATRFLPYRKEGEDESSAPAPPLEEGLPLRFQTYFSLCADSLAQHLASESMELRKELHETKALLLQAQVKTDRIKKEGAPPGQPAIAYRGGRPPKDGEPPHQHRMSARDYRKLFTPPAKQRRVELLHSPTPSSNEGSQAIDDEEEDPEEPDYATEHSTT